MLRTTRNDTERLIGNVLDIAFIMLAFMLAFASVATTYN